MRFMICFDSEKGNQAIYEIVNKKPVKITEFPATATTTPAPQSKDTKKAK